MSRRSFIYGKKASSRFPRILIRSFDETVHVFKKRKINRKGMYNLTLNEGDFYWFVLQRIVRSRDVDDCTFKEVVLGKAYTNYQVPKSNYTIAFNRHGLQSKRSQKIRHTSQQRNILLNPNSKEPKYPDIPYCESFCEDMKRIRHTKLATEIKNICGIKK